MGSRLCWLMVMVAVLVKVIEILLHPTFLAPEAAVSLDAGGLLWEGKKPYEQIFAPVLPTSLVLHALPAGLAKIIHVHPILIFHLTVVALFVLSSALIMHLSIAPNFWLVVSFALGFLSTGTQFGQDEQLFVLLFAPYLFTRLWRVQNSFVPLRYSMLSGLLAAVAVGMVHHLMPFIILTELCVCVSRHNLLKERPGARLVVQMFLKEREMLGLVIGLMISGLLLLPMLLSYWRTVLPFDTAAWLAPQLDIYYQRLAPDSRALLFAFLVVSTGAIYFRSASGVCSTLVVIAIGSMIWYLLMRSGGSHALIPLQSFTLLAAGCLVSQFVLALQEPPRMKARVYKLVRMLPVMIMIAGSVIMIVHELRQVSLKDFASLESVGYLGYFNKNDLEPIAQVLEKRVAAGKPVLILSDWCTPAYPALSQLNRKQASRYLSGYPFRTFELAKQDPDLSRRSVLVLEPEVNANLISDLQANQPALIAVSYDILGKPEAKGALRTYVEAHYRFVDQMQTHEIDLIGDQSTRIEHLGYPATLCIYTK